MLNITIDPNLKQAWPKATLGCVQCKVVTQPSGEKLLTEIAGVETWLQSTLKIEEIKTREQIAQTRACCRALGKDVQRYRNSAEAMHRRILQGKGLYQINNVVDTGNLISIKTGYSLGAYDVEKLEGDILWTATGAGVHYQGIGKDAVNIEFLPVLRDALGYFGNPNSDSTRAMITDKTTENIRPTPPYPPRSKTERLSNPDSAPCQKPASAKAARPPEIPIPQSAAGRPARFSASFSEGSSPPFLSPLSKNVQFHPTTFFYKKQSCGELLHHPGLQILRLAVGGKSAADVVQRLLQAVGAAEGVDAQQNFGGLIGNHGAGGIAVGVAKVAERIPEHRQELDVDRVLADALIVNPRTGGCPEDVPLKLFHIVGAQRVASLDRDEVARIDNVVDLVQPLALQDAAVHRLSGVAVALHVLAERLAAGAGLGNLLPGLDLLDFKGALQPGLRPGDFGEQLFSAGFHLHPAPHAAEHCLWPDLF